MKKEEAFLLLLAVRTGLEPATPCVTGMYSNQLNYRTNLLCHTSFSKASAKVLLFSDMTKYFCKKMHIYVIFLCFWADFAYSESKYIQKFAYLLKKH